jgi:acetyl esterase
LIRLRDRHQIAPFRGANLVFGAFDLELTPSARRWGERNLILSTPIIERFADYFVPDKGRRRDPEISPLHADLRGMPPALFTVGTLDPLLDDSLFMASRWASSAARSELAVYPGAVHGFTAFPTRLAERALLRSAAFLAGCAKES